MTTSNIDLITELYVGYYNRAPDPAGLEFWCNALANGISLNAIATEFAKSAESQKIYPFLSGARSFVIQVYNNVLNRDPDEAGLTFWTEQLLSGTVSPGNFIVSLEESVRMQAGTDDAKTLANKVIAGKNYASKVSATAFSAQSAHKTMEVITSDPASIAMGDAVIADTIKS